MTISPESIVAELETIFPVGALGNCATSATGELFLEFTAAGGDKEGVERWVCSNDPGTAMALLLTHLRAYAKGRSGTLYWRVKPHVYEWTIRVPGFSGGHNVHRAWMPFTVYGARARLLISERPVLETESA